MLQNRPCLHQSFSSSRRSINWYPRFTEFLSLSTIKGLQSSCLYQGFTEFPSLSKVYRVPVSIHFQGFTEFLSLSRVYRVPVSIQDLQKSSLNIFLVSGRGREKKSVENPSFTALFSFFQCHVIPHRGSVQPQETELSCIRT